MREVVFRHIKSHKVKISDEKHNVSQAEQKHQTRFQNSDINGFSLNNFGVINELLN